jgi:uracil-DNA glycosylase
MCKDLDTLEQTVISCRKCERLVQWRESVALTKRRAYKNWDYWGKPVPSLGSRDARLLIVGLAPAAHGGNRTGRIFTGDRSADFLFRALHRFGFANQAESRDRDDGLELIDTYITAAAHCAPPGNKPLPAELAACRPYLTNEIRLLRCTKAVVVLGRIAWQEYWKARSALGLSSPRPLTWFGHGAETFLEDGSVLISSYHPSQQNTVTGRLTREMFDDVFRRARGIVDTTAPVSWQGHTREEKC